MQPVLGTIGDFFGKTRLMNISLADRRGDDAGLRLRQQLSRCSSPCGFSPACCAGGIFPVGIAIVGDLVPVEQRQVAIGRLLAVGLTGNLIGATISGVIGDLLGWRGVFFTIGGFGLVAASSRHSLRFAGCALGKPKPFNFAAAAAGFRGIFADPRAKVCFGSVFFEGIIIHGMFPFVALLLFASGETRSSYAGMVIAAFGAGGILFSLSLPVLVAHITERRMMLIGAVCACDRLRPDCDQHALVQARRGVSAVRHRLLHAAQLHPGSCHRSDARPRAARRCRCIRASSSSARRSARSITALPSIISATARRRCSAPP